MNAVLKHIMLAVIVSFAITLSAYSQSNLKSKDLPNLYKVNETLYRGGQPTEAGIDQLKSMGIRTVIDLRDSDERATNESLWAKAAGLTFINIPLSNWFRPGDKKIDAVLKQIALAGNQPTFVHCKRGSDRTGTVIAAFRISNDGWTADQATAEAKKFGIGWWQFWMKDFIGDYYREHKSSQPVK